MAEPNGKISRQASVFFGALKEIGSRDVLLRLLFLGAITSMTTLYMALTSLIFAASSAHQLGDNALYIGLVAGWEVPMMMLVPVLNRFVPQSTLIAAGGALYAMQLVLLPLLVDFSAVWLLTVLGGCSGARFFSLQIIYLQDLMHDRPGTAGALLAMHKLVGDVAGSAIFAVGTTIGGYTAVAIGGCVIGLIGAAGIYVANRKGRRTSIPITGS